MRVTHIWRYPVKSLGGELMTSATIGPLGIEGDRGWGIHDVATGLVLTARREPSLLFLSSALVDGNPVITTEDGRILGDDAGLSGWIGREVRLCRASDGPAVFENPMDVEHETDWVQWESAGQTFHDGRSTISFVTLDSLGPWDERRFRINLVLDGSGEDDLVGDVGVGSALLGIRKPIERCIMVSRAQPGVDRDLGVLKRIIAERDNRMGVGAVVTRTGSVDVGDELAPSTAA